MKVYNLFKSAVILAVLMAAVEYFKYSTRLNYDWFHCTPKISEIDNSSIKQITAVGGPSCDKRGQTKSIVKKLSRTFDPNEEQVVVCLKQDEQDETKIVGFGANYKDRDLLSTYCANIIDW